MIVLNFVLSILVCSLLVSSGESRNVGTFWHFTDFHVNTSNPHRNNSGLWGDYDHDTNPIVAFTAIEFGNDYGFAENQPDFVILGGDAAPHGATVTYGELRESIRFISFHLNNAFPVDRVPVIPVMGNHDVNPANRMSPMMDDRERMKWCTELAESGDFWSSWVNNATFGAYCYMGTIVGGKNPILVLGLNSLVWYSSNPLADETIADPLEQFKWMENMFEWAKKNSIKVLLAMHVPFGTSEAGPNKHQHLKRRYNEKLVEIIRKHASNIITTIASHEHVDAFRVILDERSHPIGTMFLGPAVSPIHLEGVGSNNPRIRQFFYDRDEGVILTYRQFYLNLSQEDPSWVLEYNATEEYGLQSLTAKELAKLLDEFTSEDDKGGRWEAYWKHQLGGRPHEHPPKRADGSCPKARSVCRCEQICTVRHLDMSTLDGCLKICSSSDTPHLYTIEELINGKGDGNASSAGTVVGIVIGVLLLAGVLVGIGFLIYRKWRNS